MSLAGTKKDLKIPQGATFEQVVRWETEPFVSRQITGITQAVPARLTVPDHSMPDGWRGVIRGVKGMRQINAENWPPESDDFHRGIVVDDDTITFDDIDASGFSAYTEGGFLVFYTPKDLTDCVVRMTIRNRIGGTSLIAMDSELLGGITVDNTAKTITIVIADDDTADFTWTKGVYDLEAEDGDGKTHRLFYGTVTVIPKEVTT